MKRALLAIGAVAALIATSALLTSPSSAQEGTSDIYVVHGIPGVPVDVYAAPSGEIDADTEPLLPGFQPGDAVGPVSLPAGDYDIVVTGTGGDPTDPGDRVIDFSAEGEGPVEVPGGLDVTVVANVANDAETPTLTVIVEDLAPTGAGETRVNVRHQANAPDVDITLEDGTVLVDGLTRGDEGTLEVPAGEYTVQIRVAGTDTVVETVGPVDLAAGVLHNVYATGSAEPGSDFDFAVVLQTFDVGAEEAAEPPAEQPPADTPPPAPAPPAEATHAQPSFTG
jgi:hypothetical protein